jgi:adenine-specific DNA methylase
MDGQRGGSDLLLMTFGTILVAGALQRSTNRTTEGVRTDILSKMRAARRRWRRRGSTASNSLVLIAGMALVVYAGIRVARTAAEELTSDDSPAEAPPVLIAAAA